MTNTEVSIPDSFKHPSQTIYTSLRSDHFQSCVDDIMALPQDIYCSPKGEVALPFLDESMPPSDVDGSFFSCSIASAMVHQERMSKTMNHNGSRSTTSSSPSKKRKTRNLRSCQTARKSSTNSCLSNFRKKVQLLQVQFSQVDISPPCHMSFSSCSESTLSSFHEELNVMMQGGLPSPHVASANDSLDQWHSLETTFQKTSMSNEEHVQEDVFPHIGWEHNHDKENGHSVTTDTFQESSMCAKMQGGMKFFHSDIPFHPPHGRGLKRSKAFGSGLNCMPAANAGFLRSLHH